MTEMKPPPATPDPEHRFRDDVARRAWRKQQARIRGERTVWFSLGLMGMVGWSVALPTLAGIAVGWWIDQQWPSRLSWTLTLLFVGVVVGCLNAWRWVKQESEEH
jgi:ATP synthase protein I